MICTFKSKPLLIRRLLFISTSALVLLLTCHIKKLQPVHLARYRTNLPLSVLPTAFIAMSSIEPPVEAVFPIYPDLKGRVALITGIGQVGGKSDRWGNGAATARLLSRNGVTVFGCDLHLESAQRTKDRLLEDNPEAVVDVLATNSTKQKGYAALCASLPGAECCRTAYELSPWPRIGRPAESI